MVEVTINGYDYLDRLTSVDQRGHSVAYGYDDNGNRISVASPGGNTTYTFDSRNRLKTVVAGNPTGYTYRQNGWLANVLQGNGTTASYTYDNTGRLKTIANILADTSVLSSFAYEYDDNGNRTQQVETQNGFADSQVLTTDYVYDDLDRLESYTETSGDTYTKSHSFTYYPSYDRKTETVVENSTTLQNRSFVYDETYWLNAITESASAGGSITYGYDKNGNTTFKTNSTGEGPVSTLFSYNSRNQLKTVSAGDTGSELGQGEYHYNYAGMRIRHLGSERGDIEYVYDADSIIDEVQNGTGIQVAHYRYGDRLLSLNTSGGDQFYHYASLGSSS